jgi:hypothetical protein
MHYNYHKLQKSARRNLPGQQFLYKVSKIGRHEITFIASGGQGLFLKKPPLDPAKTFV